jgi:hypothetical protein
MKMRGHGRSKSGGSTPLALAGRVVLVKEQGDDVNTLEPAIAVAAETHTGQVDKVGAPYAASDSGG